jgi:hypothetical protein
MVIGTDYIGRCKPNYHTITVTATINPPKIKHRVSILISILKFAKTLYYLIDRMNLFYCRSGICDCHKPFETLEVQLTNAW